MKTSHSWFKEATQTLVQSQTVHLRNICTGGPDWSNGVSFRVLYFHYQLYFYLLYPKGEKKKMPELKLEKKKLSTLFTTHVSFCLHSILHYLILPSWSHWWILYPTHTATYIHTRVHYRLVSTHGGEQESLSWVWVTLLNIILSTSIYFPANFKMSFLFTAD